MKYDKFDSKTTVRAFRRELERELAEAFNRIQEKHGVEVRLGNGSFSDAVLTLKMECKAATVAGKPKHQIDWEQGHFRPFGLQAEDLHKVIRIGGDRLRVIGIRPRATKRPIVAESLTELKNGEPKKYVVPADAVRTIDGQPCWKEEDQS